MIRGTGLRLPGRARSHDGGTWERGFTLLEVMVAIAILAIALTALLGSQSQSMFVADEANFSFNSTLLARQKMAEILSDGSEPFGSSGDFDDTLPGYRWKTEVNPADFSEFDALAGSEEMVRRIDLSVSTADERRVFTLSRYVLVGGAR